MSKNVKKERPGVVVYFDTMKTLDRLSPPAQAAFLMACLVYGKNLVEPCFSNAGFDPLEQARLETLWEQTQPRIDSDARGWLDGICQRQYARYCSLEKDRGNVPMDYPDYRAWRERMDETDTPVLDYVVD